MDLQVLHLTGQSDPRSCALSPVQSAFLDALPLADEAKVRLNFPYDTGLAPYRPVPLWLGSLRHLVLFWRIRLARRRWAARVLPTVTRQLAAADRTLVLAGSIGLDLLGRLALPQDVLDRLVVVAYGAVATRPPSCRTIRVGSRGDHLARWWPHDVTVDAGHLDYLAAPELAALCRALLAELKAPR
ncbi:hypothetical protein [Pimelobacter simplex]|uniref:Uncharacterized protein n=1 Tax=Nocardioides simplex TaxID=2045 RepID=A0A0A1DLI9_NOCSI|nr:hypothetical protein [Pimelobacter simplex]AIY16245.1 hypothetical protein KR76_04770 [Pimelobacter simplex]GEB12110.1 hypothetical protein NSI01_04250 [Pimelobacter simplex]SFN17829.1 hypothetical protein SAMN05421671_5590 [Pimelobacter simplex]